MWLTTNSWVYFQRFYIPHSAANSGMLSQNLSLVLFFKAMMFVTELDWQAQLPLALIIISSLMLLVSHYNQLATQARFSLVLLSLLLVSFYYACFIIIEGWTVILSEDAHQRVSLPLFIWLQLNNYILFVIKPIS